MDGGGKSFFFTYCDSNDTFIFMSKLSKEAHQQMKFELIVQRRTYIFVSCLKKTSSLKEIYFVYSKVQVSKRTQTENLNFLGFLKTGLSQWLKSFFSPITDIATY